MASALQMSAFDPKRTCRSGRSGNDLAEPNMVPVDILRTEFATSVWLIAQPVVDFCTALYELLIKSIDVIDPEYMYQSPAETVQRGTMCL